MKNLFTGVMLALMLAVPSVWAKPILFDDFVVEGSITNSVTLNGENHSFTEEHSFGLNSGALSLLSGSADGESAFASTAAFTGSNWFSLKGLARGKGGALAQTSSSWLITFVVASPLELLFNFALTGDAAGGYGITRNGEFVGDFLDSILFQSGDVVSLDVSGLTFNPAGGYNFGWKASSVAVPEPSSLVLLGIGMLGATLVRRRGQKQEVALS